MKHGCGQLISGAGLPCSGKSSVLKQLANVTGRDFFEEPPEEEWPAEISNGESDVFTMLQWFRSVRVSKLKKAAQFAQENRIAILDSYYDVLMHHYISSDTGLDWLFPDRDSDPYFPILKETARVDNLQLPKANFLVFFRVNLKTWQAFIKSRGREHDKILMGPQAFDFQNTLLRAAEIECTKSSTKLLIFDQNVSTPQSAADALLKKLTLASCEF